MAITTYAELQTAVGNWLARSDLSSYIPDFITLAEAEICRRLRVRQMEASGDLTVSSQSVALPTGFLAARRFYLDTSPKQVLSYVAPEDFWDRYIGTNTGRPIAFTLEGDNVIVGPAPDATYTGKLLYWKRQDVSASAHTLFTQNPDLYLYGALLQAESFIQRDERTAFWRAQFEKAVADLALHDAKDRHSGSVLQARPYPRAV